MTHHTLRPDFLECKASLAEAAQARKSAFEGMTAAKQRGDDYAHAQHHARYLMSERSLNRYASAILRTLEVLA